MKLTLSHSAPVTVLAAAAALAACAPAQTGTRGAQMQTQAGSSSGAGQQMAGNAADSDMCRDYRSMTQAADPSARQSMMERQMQDLPADQRERQMQMMRERCQEPQSAPAPDRP